VSEKDGHGGFPYLRVVTDIRRRVEMGDLRPGDRVPSTRDITREWGVAMATASKALAALRSQGVVRVIPGVGAVVAEPPLPTTGEPGEVARATPGPSSRHPVTAPTPGLSSTAGARPQGAPRATATQLTRVRIAEAGIDVADREGLAAVSMRRVATTLDVAPMSLYRHVANKDDLVVAMMDAVFARSALPAQRPGGWRAPLEMQARLQWQTYCKHPWVAQALSFTRPQATPNTLPHTEWALAAIEDLGLGNSTMMYIAVTVFNYVRGMAVNVAAEAEAQLETGVSSEEFLGSQADLIGSLVATGRFPVFASVVADPELDVDLEVLFEFGLQLLLDGLHTFIARRHR
jgi:AcrR family transcriptional regulator